MWTARRCRILLHVGFVEPLLWNQPACSKKTCEREYWLVSIFLLELRLTLAHYVHEPPGNALSKAHWGDKPRMMQMTMNRTQYRANTSPGLTPSCFCAADTLFHFWGAAPPPIAADPHLLQFVFILPIVSRCYMYVRLERVLTCNSAKVDVELNTRRLIGTILTFRAQHLNGFLQMTCMGSLTYYSPRSIDSYISNSNNTHYFESFFLPCAIVSYFEFEYEARSWCTKSTESTTMLTLR